MAPRLAERSGGAASPHAAGSGADGAGDAGGRRLDTYASNASLGPGAATVRAHRYNQRRALRRGVSDLPRLRDCGAKTIGGSVALMRSGAGVARFHGLETCGSVWACPVCSGRIMAGRGKELRAGAERWTEGGGALGLLTLTMRHKRGDGLAALWNGLSAAWRAVASGSGWIRDKQDHGIDGFVRAVEITHGANGWHLHIHALLFLNAPLGVDARAALFGRLFARWSNALVKAGLEAPLAQAQDLRMVRDADAAMADYLAKAVSKPRWTAAEEVARGDLKTARPGSRSVWDLLDLAMDRDPLGVALWREWEKESRGRRQMTWSRGLRDRLALGEEAEDEALAEIAEGDENADPVADEVVAILTPENWRRVLNHTPNFDAELLRLAEIGPRYARDALYRALILFDRPGP